MPDWLIVWLGHLQGSIVQLLSTEMRAGGTGAVWFAFALGALHALTPGHGKAALAAYFLGREAHPATGIRVALTGALLHVLSGITIFLVLRFIVGQLPTFTGRPSPTFTVVGYGLIVVAGAIMILQSLRPAHAHTDGTYSLTAGIGLLPCPLTISVLGFAWTQSDSAMIGLALISLALGIAFTIGIVAVAAIIGRRALGVALARHLPGVERWSRIAQGAAGLLIVIIGLATILRA